MKTISTIILAIVLTCNFVAAQDTMYVYRAGIVISKQAVADVDSVIFFKPIVTTMPSLTTSNVTAVTANSAICGGSIINNGGTTITVSGVSWGTSENPTIASSITTDGATSGSFTSSIIGLISNTTYYVRAYATNSVGTAYGNQISFTTSGPSITIPTITTTAASNITSTTATLGGSVTSDGGATTTECGVCISTLQNPTTSIKHKYANGTGVGIFSFNFTGFAVNTTYYVRAYAINSVGTSYGNEVSFTTQSVVADIDGNVYHTVTIGTQVWMVENLKTTKYNDGTSIPLVSDGTAWSNLSTPGYCFYDNDATNKNRYGALYNWYTVNTNKLAPTGWHVPTDAEWTTLTTYLTNNGYGYGGSGSDIAKSMASTFGWISYPDAGAVGNSPSINNSCGFAGPPGSYRYTNGTFNLIGLNGYWWSSTQDGTYHAWDRNLSHNYGNVFRNTLSKQGGFSVRCVRD